MIAGSVGLVRPMRRLRLPTRARAALCTLAGIVVVVFVGSSLPAARDVPRVVTGLDEVSPRFHFAERHETRVAAPTQRVFEAIKAVSAGEIALFQAFTAIRRFGRSGPESILNPPPRESILDVATRTGFLLLMDRPPRELVLGTVVLAPADFRRSDARTPERFERLRQSGFAKATMNFLVEPEGASASRVVTETRVFATSDDALARFTPYWRAIYPGSAILRVTWLRAIKARAEAGVH